MSRTTSAICSVSCAHRLAALGRGNPRRVGGDEPLQLGEQIVGAVFEHRNVVPQRQRAGGDDDRQPHQHARGAPRKDGDRRRRADVLAQTRVVRHEDVGEEHRDQERAQHRRELEHQVPAGRGADEQEDHRAHGVGVAPLGRDGVRGFVFGRRHCGLAHTSSRGSSHMISARPGANHPLQFGSPNADAGVSEMRQDSLTDRANRRAPGSHTSYSQFPNRVLITSCKNAVRNWEPGSGVALLRRCKAPPGSRNYLVERRAELPPLPFAPASARNTDAECERPSPDAGSPRLRVRRVRARGPHVHPLVDPAVTAGLPRPSHPRSDRVIRRRSTGPSVTASGGAPPTSPPPTAVRGGRAGAVSPAADVLTETTFCSRP